MLRQRKQAGFAEPHSSSTIGWVGVKIPDPKFEIFGSWKIFGSQKKIKSRRKKFGPEICFGPESNFGPEKRIWYNSSREVYYCY